MQPGLLLTIVAFALVIGPLIFVHEMGHYLVGRWFGIKADAFSIGFGREILGWTDKLGTRWKLSVLPLGGYVRFAGDMNPASQPTAEWLALPAAERARTFQAKPVWQRALVVAAGPAVNFLAAILILGGFAVAHGVDRTPAMVAAVAPGSAAAQAGIRAGDQILAMDTRKVTTFEDIADFAQLRPGSKALVTLVRGGDRLRLPITIGVAREVDRFGNVYRLGRIGIAGGTPVAQPVSLLQAPVEGVRATGQQLRRMLDGLGQIITGRRSLDELGGPIQIARLSGEGLAIGPAALVWLIALVSINLGFINLLPVPILDGGHLFFYAIEAVRRRPVDAAVQEWAFRTGMAAILALMLTVTINDLGNLGLWKGLAGLIG
jgi:regulator of sigma E protease